MATNINSKTKAAEKKFRTEKEKNLDRLSYRDQGDFIFALDIGTRTVVGIIGEYIEEKFYIRDCISVPHTKRAMVDGQIEDIKQVSKMVAKTKELLEERNGLNLKKVSIAAAGRALKTVRESMTFDISDKDSITDVMVNSMEIETIQKAQKALDEDQKNQNVVFYCVGHSVIKYSLDDYKIISLTGHKGNTTTVEIIAAFLPNVVVESLYSVMDLNGLEVASITLEPIAAMNVIIPPEIRFINIALVDIGAGTSDIAIARDGSIVAYAMATTAGDEISEEIIKTFFVDFSTAEDMKMQCTDGNKEINFKDIFGIPQKISTDDFYSKLQPAVDVLAETICNAMCEVNGSSPAAVFLIGGGSLVSGLQENVAKRLGIDKARVAVGGQDFLKNVETGEFTLGAEFVTPIGIGVTNVLNQGYDFSTIQLNDQKVRIFDTKKLTVFELLTMSGYKSTEIMGRSGRNLPYTLNGKRLVEKGGTLTPASIYVNDKQAALTTPVTQGDKVRIVSAINGENAVLRLSEVVDYSMYKTGEVMFKGEKYKIGLTVLVNEKEKEPDYEIQPLDEIETLAIQTLGNLLKKLDEDVSDYIYTVNGDIVTENFSLSDGDEIGWLSANPAVSSVSEKEEASEQPVLISATASAEQEQPAEETAPMKKSIPLSAPIPEKTEPESIVSEPEAKYPEKDCREIIITLNGKRTMLPKTDGTLSHLFLELLNYVDIDPTNPQGDIILTLNGENANFNDELKDGDTAVIKWAART